MKRAQIHALCNRLGLRLEVTSRGDTRALYHFHDARTQREVHIAKGRAAALTFLAGVEWGLDRDLIRPEVV